MLWANQETLHKYNLLRHHIYSWVADDGTKTRIITTSKHKTKYEKCNKHNRNACIYVNPLFDG
jgi:hypothetical protein